jgi:hypothetical protein
VDLDAAIAQAEAQERALAESLAETRGYLRALREVRAALLAAQQPTRPAEEPAELSPAEGEG